MITCPYCHETSHQNKAGRTKAGSQRYRCRHCSRKYIAGSKPHDDQLAVPELGVETRLGDVSAQSTAPQLLLPPPKEASGVTERSPAYPIVRAAPTNYESTQSSISTSVSAELLETSPRLSVAFPASRKPRFLSKVVESAATSNQWGWLPEIALLVSFGLLITAWSFAEARAATRIAPLLFWVGLAVMILPVAVRLAFAEISRRERITLVLLLGMALYLIKVMHSPFAFTFPDELTHLRNVREILETQRLFQENPVQPVTTLYPGLPILTSTLSSLSGLPIFPAGLVVIGVARLILFLALYLLFEQVGGSARIASLGAVIYMANPNFLYWTAEYAYEPLALPLLIFVLFMIARREMAADRSSSGAWMIAAVFGLLTVVITHHMSSYILTGLLVAITIFFIVHSRGKYWGPWQLALLAVVATSSWLILVANLTIDYLAPVLGGAVDAALKMIAEEETGRELFTASKAVSEASAPLWEQIVALGSVIVIVIGLPFGAYEIWKRHRSKVLAFLLGGIALAYLPVQMLRFTSAGWETANRSSEFLYIGIGFLLALAVVGFWLSRWDGWKSKLILGALSVTLVFGGLIAGWPPRARLARPYVIGTDSHLVRPQIVTVSEWMLEYLGPDNRIAASKADAKVMGAYNQYPFTGIGPIKDLFLSEEFGRSERKSLLKRDIQYVVSDRKDVSWDHMIGYYFYSRYTNRSSDLKLIEPAIFEKLEGLAGMTRMLDSGDIVIYDVETYLAAFDDQPGSTVIDTPDIIPNTGTISSQTSMVTPVPGPGCIWYMVRLNDKPINLMTLASATVNGAGQMQCIDWGVR